MDSREFLDEYGQAYGIPSGKYSKEISDLLRDYAESKSEWVGLKIRKSNEAWDKAVVKALWAAWKSRPDKYMDANGVSMCMQIDSMFKSSGVDEPDKIELNIILSKYVDIELYEDGFSSGRKRMRLSIDKAKSLMEQLSEALSDDNLK